MPFSITRYLQNKRVQLQTVYSTYFHYSFISISWWDCYRENEHWRCHVHEAILSEVESEVTVPSTVNVQSTETPRERLHVSTG